MVMDSIFSIPDQGPTRDEDQQAYDPMREYARGTPSYQQFSQAVNAGAPAPAPPTSTGMGGGSWLDQAQQYAQQTGQLSQPTGADMWSHLGELGRDINYGLGAPGRVVDNLLPSGTPDIVREGATFGANLLPFAAAELATGGTATPVLLGGAGMFGAQKGSEYLAQQGGLPGAVGEALARPRIPEEVPLVGGASIAQLAGGLGLGRSSFRPEETAGEIKASGSPGVDLGARAEEVLQTPETRPPTATGTAPPPEITSYAPGSPEALAHQAGIEDARRGYMSQDTQGIGDIGNSRIAAYREGLFGERPGFRAPLDINTQVQPDYAGGPANLTPQAGTGPGMEQFNQQRGSGLPGGEATAVVDNNAGRTGTGGGVSPTPPTAGPGGLVRSLQEIAYAPLAMDWGTTLRQGAPRVLNPFRIGQTRQALADGIAAAKSAEGSRFVNEAIRNDPRLTAMFGENPMHFAATDGSQPLSARETNFSKAFSFIPGYDSTTRTNATIINSIRGNGIKEFLDRNPNATPAQALHEIHYLERITGHGSVPEALQVLGPLFTSLRFAASIPERIGYLLPLQRLPDGTFEAFGKTWQEAMVDHAGFITTGLAAMALAEQAGAKVGWNPLQQSDDKEGNPGFGVIKAGPIHVDLWGGARQYVTTAIQMATGEKNGRPYPAILGEGKFGYQGSLAEFGRNKLGPLASATFAGAKYSGLGDQLGIQKQLEFLRPDYWDQGLTGSNTTADKIANNLTFLWMRDLADAIKETPGDLKTKLAVGGVAGALSFLGTGVTSYSPSAGAQVTQSGTTALSDPAKLAQAFPDSPIAQKALLGKQYSDLLPNEKAAIRSALDPAEVKAMDDANAQTNPAMAMHSAAIDALQSRKTQAEDRILDMYNAGQMDKPATRAAMFAVQNDYYTNKAKVDADPAYQKELADLRKLGDQADAQKALDAYYQISQHYQDKTERQKAEGDYIRWLNSRDPELASRIVLAIQPRNQTELERLYRSGALSGR